MLLKHYVRQTSVMFPGLVRRLACDDDVSCGLSCVETRDPSRQQCGAERGERRQGRAEVGPLITAAQHPAAHTMATTSIVKKSIVSKNNEFGGFPTLKL